MNEYNLTYKGEEKKRTLSVNKDLVASAKKKRINLSAF
jgi:post-segregation antitoxin (ccd killing protein)